MHQEWSLGNRRIGMSLEILNFTRRDPVTDICEVWDYWGARLFEGTRAECENFIDNYEDDGE
jgi:hypothetical protein